MGFGVEQAPSVAALVRGLIDERPPRPQVLIADFDAMSAADVLHLHQVRERGWFGSIVALGAVPEDLRVSLNIETILKRPFTSETLRKAMTQIGLDRPTTNMPKLAR